MSLGEMRGALRGKELKKTMWLWFLMLVTPCYAAFVVQALWNWFVIDALHAATVSYAQALGFIVLLYVVRDRTHVTNMEERHFSQLYVMTRACIPSYERQVIMKEVSDVATDGWLWPLLDFLGKITVCTCALAAGWGIHTFLM